MAHRLQWCASIWYAWDVYIRIKKRREKKRIHTYIVYIVCHFTLYIAHNARQCYHWEWNDARFMLFETTTIVVSTSNNKNNIDDDDIEKIQFATKIEIEREKKHRSIEIAVCRKDDCLQIRLLETHISIFAWFLLLCFALRMLQRTWNKRSLLEYEKKYHFIEIDLWKWFCLFFFHLKMKKICVAS